MEKKKIILIDDRKDILIILAEVFEIEDNFSVKAFGSVDEAESTLRNETVDLIISDWDMPGRNGGEVAAILNEIKSHTPLVFYTGEDQSASFWRSLKYPSHVVMKPHTDELKKIALALLRARAFETNIAQREKV